MPWGSCPCPGRGDARVAPPCPTTLCVWRRLPYLTLACPDNGRHLARDTAQGGGASTFSYFFFVLSGEISLGAHGLLRFRTNDVLLGTSGVGVCVSVVSNSSGMCYIGFRTLPPFNRSVSCSEPFRWREVPSSNPVRPLYFLFTPERAQFCSDAPPNSKSCPHA